MITYHAYTTEIESLDAQLQIALAEYRTYGDEDYRADAEALSATIRKAHGLWTRINQLRDTRPRSPELGSKLAELASLLGLGA